MSKAVKAAPKRAVVAAVQLAGVSDLEFESSLSELRELAKTLGFEVVGTFTQKRTSFDSTAYLGVGKREEMRRFVQGEPAASAADGTSSDADGVEQNSSELVEKRKARHGAVAAREEAKALAA
jgi:GTP-binding protein HflX